MAVPTDKEARRFYHVAQQRMEEAKLLFDHQRFRAAQYLGGYTVECILKALLLASAKKRERDRILEGFRGHKAHNLEDLRNRYARETGGGFPPAFSEAFQFALSWSPDLRYQPGKGDQEEVNDFLNAVKIIFELGDRQAVTMAKKKQDEEVAVVLAALEGFRKDHPKAVIEAYRYNESSIRIRIVDAAFEDQNLVERDRMIRPFLRQLPETVFWQVTMVLLLTPKEKRDPLHFLNHEFEHPSRSNF